MEKVRPPAGYFIEVAHKIAGLSINHISEHFEKQGLLPLGEEQTEVVAAAIIASIRFALSTIAEQALTGMDVTFAVLPQPPIDPDAAPSPL